MKNGWGTGSSPALDSGRLFILCDNEQQSFLTAIDADTGEKLWRVKREEESNWTTPFVWRNKHRTEIVAGGGTAIRSCDPATGELLWHMDQIKTNGPPAKVDELSQRTVCEPSNNLCVVQMAIAFVAQGIGTTQILGKFAPSNSNWTKGPSEFGLAGIEAVSATLKSLS